MNSNKFAKKYKKKCQRERERAKNLPPEAKMHSATCFNNPGIPDTTLKLRDTIGRQMNKNSIKIFEVSNQNQPNFLEAILLGTLDLTRFNQNKVQKFATN